MPSPLSPTSLPPYLSTLSLLLSSLSLPSPLTFAADLTPSLLLSILSLILNTPLSLPTPPTSTPTPSSLFNRANLAQLKLALGVLETSTRVDYSALNPVDISTGRDPEGLEMIGRGVILLAMLQGWDGQGQPGWRGDCKGDGHDDEPGVRSRQMRTAKRGAVPFDSHKFTTPAPRNLPLPIVPIQRSSSFSPPSSSRYFEFGLHSSFRSSTPKLSPRPHQSSQSRSNRRDPPLHPHPAAPNRPLSKASASSSLSPTSISTFTSNLRISSCSVLDPLPITKHNAPSAYAKLRADAEAELEDLIQLS